MDKSDGCGGFQQAVLEKGQALWDPGGSNYKVKNISYFACDLLVIPSILLVNRFSLMKLNTCGFILPVLCSNLFLVNLPIGNAKSNILMVNCRSYGQFLGI